MDRLLDLLPRILFLCGLGLIIGLSGFLRPVPAGAETLPDPTKPESPGRSERGNAAQAQQRKKPSWELTSIIHSPQRKLAVINGEIRQVDEDIAGARVLKILPDTVIILYRGQRRVLRLLPRGSGLNRSGNNRE
ncbi:MAG: hypothetical protein V5B78_09605 [Desulfohalobiaceae bacterium]